MVILEPKAKRGTTYALDGEITIGRDSGCTVTIEGTTSSPNVTPASTCVDGQPMVEDLGSTNGSFYNGNRLQGTRLLHPGDRVQFGYTVLEAQ